MTKRRVAGIQVVAVVSSLAFAFGCGSSGGGATGGEGGGDAAAGHVSDGGKDAAAGAGGGKGPDASAGGDAASDVPVTFAQILVTPTSGLATTEGGAQASFAVVLDTAPTANVTISLASNNIAEGTVSPATLLFTPLNWNAPQIVTVTGVDDTVKDGDVHYLILTGAAVSDDPHYAGVDPPDVELSNIDDESAGVLVKASDKETSESGGQAKISVVLTSKPKASVTIPVESGDVSEGTVSPDKLVFTPENWNAPQTITVTGVDDPDADGPQMYSVLLGAVTSTDTDYANYDPADVVLTNTDNDTAGLTVKAPAVGVTTERGGQASFTVVLNSRPSSAVVVPVASNDAGEGKLSVASLTFTPANWSAPQTVTVTGVDDAIADGNQVYRVTVGPTTSDDAGYKGLHGADVNLSNTDDDSAGVTTAGTDNLHTTEAGGQATFTVVLNSQPGGDVTISVVSRNTAEGTASPASLKFTSANWNAPQTVTVTGADDSVADGNQPYQIELGPPVSSDASYASLVIHNLTVTNDDNDTAGITVAAAPNLATSESGGQATFTVVLNSQPTAAVVVSLASSNVHEGLVSPSFLTFTALNWNAPQTVTVTGVNDDVADGNQPYRILTAAATSQDVGYGGLDAADVDVSNTDNDSAGVTVSAGANLVTTEGGGQATFAVVLNSQPRADVTIALSSSDAGEATVVPASLTFTAANWNAPQTVTVTGVNDDVADGNQPYFILTAPAMSTDSGYAGTDAANVPLTNLDNDTASIVVTAAAGLSTTEGGGQAAFTVVLGSKPVADVTVPLASSDLGEGTIVPTSLTFTAANWNAPQTVTVTGVNDNVADGNQPYSVLTLAATSADSNYNGYDAANVSLTNTDNDSAGITVVAASNLATTEVGGQATFTIVLNSEPVGDVIIPVATSDLGEGTVSPASLTFTATNWNAPQVVTVTGVNDDIADGNQPYSILTGAATSVDPEYSGLDAANVSLTNTDNDSAGITVVAAQDLATTEAGGQATFTIVLNSQPRAPVTVALASSALGEGTVSPAALTFTAANWNAPQTVTVTGVNDDVADGNQPYSIVTAQATGGDATYAAIDPPDVTLTNTDNDSAGITLLPPVSFATTEAGVQVVFKLVLNSQPVGPVTIGLTSSALGEGTVSPASVTFTAANWNAPQTVTVTGVNDDVADGNQPYSIVTAQATSTDAAYAAIDPADLSLSNTDNDSAGISVVAGAGLTTSEGGGTTTFTLVLNSQPFAPVVIALGSSDTTEGTVSPASLTFTAVNWNAPQTVTVTGVNDDVADGNQPYSIVTAQAVSTDAAYAAIDPPDVSVSNTDNDSAGITVNPSSGLSTTELGGTATFTVVLNSQPTADVTIPLSTSDATEGTVLPTSLTFTAANWSTPQTVTVTGVPDVVADGDQPYSIVTGAATSGDSGYSGRDATDVSLTNIDGNSAGFTITPTSGLVTTEGGATATFTVVLTSQPSGDVVLALSSSDIGEGTVSPASLTFTSANWNTPQTVTVTGANDSAADGDQPYTIVTAAATSTDNGYNGINPADVSVTNDDDDVAGMTLSGTSGLSTNESGTTATFTVVLDTKPSADVVIPIVSGNLNEGTVSPSALTFTSANWSTPQTVTITGVNDNVVDGDVTYSVLVGPAASADSHYNGLDPADPSVVNRAVTVAANTLAVGVYHSCALNLNGAAYCWGYNNSGQLGDGSLTIRTSPVAVQTGVLFTALSTKYLHTCGLTSAGVAYCWGENGSGALGDGTTTRRTQPVAVSGGLTFVELAAGYLFTCGRTSTGAAYCWGNNGQGQLGDGTRTNRTSPVAVAGGNTFVQLVAENGSVCGLTAAGTAYCWGQNIYGQLGNGTTSLSTTPVAVSGGLTFTKLMGQWLSSCGLTASGDVYCWGYNVDGQLGNGSRSNTSSLSPGLVQGGLAFTDIATSAIYVPCGRVGTAAYCWGYDANGQVGDQGTADVLSPVPSQPSLAFTSINSGHEHACGLSSGLIYCWGNNDEGQLGDGTMTSRSTPGLVTLP